MQVGDPCWVVIRDDGNEFRVARAVMMSDPLVVDGYIMVYEHDDLHRVRPDDLFVDRVAAVRSALLRALYDPRMDEDD